MVAPGKIRCRIIEVPAGAPFSSSYPNHRLSSNLSEMMPRPKELKPSELLPWSDSYIAGLVAKLQREVRHERQVEWQATEVVDDKDISLYSRELADFELDMADVFAPATVEAEWPWFHDDFGDDFEDKGPDGDHTRDWDDGSGDVPTLV